MKTPEEILSALDVDQQQVALQVRGPLCVRAGAGTGKTRAITYRIAYGAATGAIDPGSVLAVTFTSRAAAEMRARLRDLGVPGVQARTFHAAALRQLSYFWGRAFGGDRPEIIKSRASLVASAAARVGVSVDKTLVRDLAAEIEWVKVSMTGPEKYPDVIAGGRETPGVGMEDFLRVYEAYEQAKIERRVIDFEDVLALTCGLLLENDDIAKQVRSQYRSFVVDEYQDVSALQHRLLDLWRGNRKDICVVGDIAQTIYSFTGADPGYLAEFKERFPEGNVLELNRDYRSTPQIVAVANRIMAKARGLDGIGPERGLPGAVKLISQEASGPAVRFADYATDEAEAEQVAELIALLAAEDTPLSQIAVLYRTNAQSEAFEQALSSRGIGVQIQGGTRFFEREEIRRAVVLLRQAERIQALTAMEVSEPLEYQVQSVVASLGWSPAPPAVSGAVRERWENLDALLAMTKNRPNLTLSQFVAELQERGEAQAAPEVNGVILSTLHAAKGLEWDAVFLVGLSEGLMPISLAESPGSVEEERRLLYVGVTRARKHLQLSWSRSRGGGRSSGRKISRFLQSIWPEQSSVAAPTTDRARRAKRKADFEEKADSRALKLFDDLRAWRLNVAREREIPAFAVLTDASLREVSLSRPRTLKQLLLTPGIGETKLADFGPEVLAVVREHLDDQ